MAFIAAFN
ncbi:hypothetical protein Tco_0521665, partial [Tanacetum coccineum]